MTDTALSLDTQYLASSLASNTTVEPSKTTARLAGVLYLLVGVFGGFAEGFVEPKMYAAGDAAATFQNLLFNAGLVRAGVVADLLNQAFFLMLAITLYALLRHVNRSVARGMVVLVAVAAAIASLNTVFLFEGLQVAIDPTYLTAFGPKGVEALALLLVDMQHYGLLTAQVFFGLWLAPLGYLVFKSCLFPKALGAVLMFGAACYLVDLLAAFLAPGISTMIHGFVVIPCAVAEIAMVVYLLAVGVRSSTPAIVESNDDLCS